MKDSNIENKIRQLKTHVAEINKLLAELHEDKVDVRLSYSTQTESGGKPALYMRTAVQSVNYLE